MDDRDKLTGFPSIDKPWLKYYSKEQYTEQIPKTTIYDLIFSRNKNRLDAQALLYFGKKISYRKLFSETEKVTKALTHIGVKRGSVVNLLVASVPEAVYLVLSCSKIGALANFINPLFSEKQIIDRINDTNSPFLFVLDIMEPLVKKVVSHTCIEHVVTIPVYESMPLPIKMVAAIKTNKTVANTEWKKFLALGSEETISDCMYIADSPVVMVYSSGTTGASKGIVLTNESITSTCIMEKNSLPLMVESSFLAIIPIWFSTGISCSIIVPLANGGTVILEPKYGEESFVRDIEKWRPKGILGTSSLWEHAISEIRLSDLSFIQSAISGGEPISHDFEKRVNGFLKERKCAYTLVKGYGQCELGGTVTLSKTGDDFDEFQGVGIPLSHVCISAFDMDTDNEKKVGEIGELRVLSPARMKGYYDRPQETKAKFREDCEGRIWVCTEDAGFIKEDGHVVVLGRMSDSFVSKNGKRIFLFHIKQTILENPFVTRCEVVKSEGLLNGSIVAHLVLQKNANVGNALSEIHNYCIQKLEPEEIPAAYKVRDTFELNQTSGKVDTEVLKHEQTGFINSNDICLDLTKQN